MIYLHLTHNNASTTVGVEAPDPDALIAELAEKGITAVLVERPATLEDVVEYADSLREMVRPPVLVRGGNSVGKSFFASMAGIAGIAASFGGMPSISLPRPREPKPPDPDRLAKAEAKRQRRALKRIALAVRRSSPVLS